MNFLIALFFTATGPAAAADWSRCPSDLSEVSRVTRDSEGAAEDIKRASDDYERCMRYPEMYDTFKDQCRSRRDDYDRALSRVTGKLDTVRRRIKDASLSCDLNLGSDLVLSPAPAAGNRACDVYRAYLGKLPVATILEICAGSLSEAACRACLE